MRSQYAVSFNSRRVFSKWMQRIFCATIKDLSKKLNAVEPIFTGAFLLPRSCKRVACTAKLEGQSKSKLNVPFGHKKTIQSAFHGCGYSGTGRAFHSRTTVCAYQRPSTNAM
jgi:hypothetical protein